MVNVHLTRTRGTELDAQTALSTCELAHLASSSVPRQSSFKAALISMIHQLKLTRAPELAEVCTSEMAKIRHEPRGLFLS